MMNNLDELVYSMEDLSLLEEINVFMNKGETGGPQGKFEASSSMKREWQEPEQDDKNFANRAKKNNEFAKNYHDNSKSKFMPNRMPKGEIGAQFLDLDCKRDPEESIDLWSQNMLLYFLLGKGNYTNEERYTILINTFIGKVKI